MASRVEYRDALRRVYALEREGNVEWLIHALDSPVERGPDTTVRAAAAAALGRIGDLRATEPLVSLLDDPSEEVRYAAVRSLTKIGAAVPTAALLPLTRDESLNVRRAALLALGSLDDDESLPVLRETMTSDDPWLRLYAAEALAGGDDEEYPRRVAEAASRERFNLREPFYSLGRRKRWKRLLSTVSPKRP
jgi:HEAT repeat protein